MAFTSTVTARTVFGDKRVVYGTYTNTGGGAGGDIATGLSRVDAIFLQTSGAAVSADQSAVDETFPLSGGDVTVVNTADSDGYYMAFGS